MRRPPPARKSYQDYTIRTQVSDGLLLAGEYKAAVAAALLDGVDYTTIDNDLIRLPDTPDARYVTYVEVGAGAIQITYGGEAHATIDEGSLALVPGRTDAGDVVWVCGYAPLPAGVIPYLQDHQNYSSIDEKYLPSSCR